MTGAEQLPDYYSTVAEDLIGFCGSAGGAESWSREPHCCRRHSGTHPAMPDESVDVVVSRGSFYFWQDRAKGLREVRRILRPGGHAMIGGGLGRNYPEWARREFINRKRKSADRNGPAAACKFAEARSSETFRRLAEEAGLPAFEVIGEGGLGPDDPKSGIGIWVRFQKETDNDKKRQ